MAQRIIALVDGSIYSASLCDHVAWAAERLGTGVDLLHVNGLRETGPEASALGTRSTLQAELAALDAQRLRLADLRGQAILDDACELVRKGGIEDVTATLEHGDLIPAIRTREAVADLIAIGKRGEGADDTIGQLGSNLERIARAATKPVLVAARAFRPISRVMIAHDGSAASLRAVDYIARSPLFVGLDVTVATAGEPSAEIERRHRDALAVLKAGGIKAQARVVPGAPDVALSALVEAENFDMLVMAGYAHSRLRHFFIGSVTASLLLSCRVPVLLLR